MGIKIEFGTYKVQYNNDKHGSYCTQVPNLLIEIELNYEGGKKIYLSNLKPTHDMSPDECLDADYFVFINPHDKIRYFTTLHKMKSMAEEQKHCVNSQFYPALADSVIDIIFNPLSLIDMGLHNLFAQNYSELVKKHCEINQDISLLEL